MSNMKCPICNKGTVKGFETAPYFACSNEFCPSYSETDTTEYDILIRTRKALDVARHTIGWINQMIDEHTDKQAIKIKCEYALQKITALEQKD